MKVLLIPVIRLLSDALYPQSSDVSGIVMTSDNQSLAFACVSFKGGSKGALPIREGTYNVAKVRPETYLTHVISESLRSDESHLTKGGEVQVNVFRTSDVELQDVCVFVAEKESIGKERLYLSKMSLSKLKNSRTVVSRPSGRSYGISALYANEGSANVFTLPAYTTLNVSVSYNAPEFRVALKVNHLTDKKYYSGWSTIIPQQPRSILGSIAYKY